MDREPSGHIFRNAVQFFELARPAYDDRDVLNKTCMAVVCNLALSVELLLKSCDAGVKTNNHSPGQPLTDAEIYSNAWGHDLEKIYDSLDASIKTKVTRLFHETTNQDLRPILSKYKDYFIHARYSHEPRSGHSYDVSGIKNLAEDLIVSIKKWHST